MGDQRQLEVSQSECHWQQIQGSAYFFRDLIPSCRQAAMLRDVLDVGEMSPLVVTLPDGLLHAIEEASRNKGDPHYENNPAQCCCGHFTAAISSNHESQRLFRS